MSDSIQLCSSNEDDAVNNEVFFSSPRSSNSKNGQGLSSVFPKLDETCGDIKKIEQLGADGTNKTNIDNLKTQLWKKSYEDSTVEKSKKIPSPPSIDHILKENFSSAELSRMLSIILDNSSDVLAIGNVCQNESITTRVSPTFFKMVGLPETNELVITQNLSEFVNASSSCESPEELKRTRIAKYGNREAEIRELMVKAWNNESGLLLTDFSHENGTVFRCEAQTSRINETSLVVIIRDITERQKRFDAEKLAATELTARKKDAEVNRFTRHEINKNGLLAAIGKSGDRAQRGRRRGRSPRRRCFGCSVADRTAAWKTLKRIVEFVLPFSGISRVRNDVQTENLVPVPKKHKTHF